jgi:tetratricopeptide (TPR) repeat protein
VTDYEVRHLDDIEEITDGRCPWRPVRHEFGITSFGVNAWIGREAGDRLINEHDEEGEDEELYMVTAGRARFQLGDDTVDAPAGTFVFARPGLTRTAFAEEAGTTLLAIGGRPGEVYEPSGFELWAPIAPLYQEGRYAEAADQAAPLADANPQYAGLAYNTACLESLAGRPQRALEHLRRAIEGSERFREFARGDSDFDPIREEPAFKELVGGE